MGKLLETTTQKLDFINDTLIELSKKYETITYRVTELEKKDQRWEKNHKTMQHTQPSAEQDSQQPLENQNQEEQKQPDLDNTVLEEQQPVPEKVGFFLRSIRI
jgi:chromosome segregation ATPase